MEGFLGGRSPAALPLDNAFSSHMHNVLEASGPADCRRRQSLQTPGPFPASLAVEQRSWLHVERIWEDPLQVEEAPGYLWRIMSQRKLFVPTRFL